MQLVHYTPNDIGDFQTGTITHQGLSEFGVEVIRACHRLGLVCDVAHATEDMVKQTKVANVSIRTDQFDSRGCVEDYWVYLVAAMLRDGFTGEEAGKIRRQLYAHLPRCGR